MSKTIRLVSVIRYFMILVVLVMAVFLQIGTKNSSADIMDVSAAVKNGVDFDALQESNNLMIKKIYGFNVNDYEGIVYYAPKTNMDADEILIIKLKDQSQAEAVEESILKRVETQKASFEGYGIEQFNLLENHVLDIKGNYVLFAVHSQADKIDQIFCDSL